MFGIPRSNTSPVPPTDDTEPEKSRFHIGMRNIKTGLSVFLCLLFYQLLNRDGYFLACTSAIICMQDSVEKSVKSGANRFIGTALGAAIGTLLLYLDGKIPSVDLSVFTASCGTILLILVCNILQTQNSIVIGCVVLLSIVLQQNNMPPIAYGLNRTLDTFFGIFISIIVNRFLRGPRMSRTTASNSAHDQQHADGEALAQEDNTLDDISETN